LLPFLDELRISSETKTISNLIKQIYDFILKNYAQSLSGKSSDIVNQLISKAQPFERRLKDFLNFTVLQKETDAYDPRADRVTLMTLHASKGLEFPVVFIIGCEEDLIPYQKKNRPCDLEEERRLFYVGMTRAQQKLVLTHAKTRFLFGKTCQSTPSRFISDIENALLEFKKMKPRKHPKKAEEDRQLKLF
jgi:superfamily I DNA/RNA helicase